MGDVEVPGVTEEDLVAAAARSRAVQSAVVPLDHPREFTREDWAAWYAEAHGLDKPPGRWFAKRQLDTSVAAGRKACGPRYDQRTKRHVTAYWEVEE